jgi:hypothetical protein
VGCRAASTSSVQPPRRGSVDHETAQSSKEITGMILFDLYVNICMLKGSNVLAHASIVNFHSFVSLESTLLFLVDVGLVHSQKYELLNHFLQIHVANMQMYVYLGNCLKYL